MNKNRDKKVLVLDDQRDSLIMLRRILEEMKYENIELVTSAENGLELIEACKEKPFDIILSDYNMGERMNGQQLLEELVRRNLLEYSTIFIMVSAETSKEMVLSALECRPDACISKPFNFKTVSNKINRLLKEKNVLQPVFEAQKMGDFSEAIVTCREIVNSSPAPGLTLLRFFGNMLLEYKEYQEAYDQFQKCMPSNPPDWVVTGQARALMGLDQEEQAMEVLEGLVNTITTELKAYDLLAELKLKMNRPADAQLILSKAIALSPNIFTRQHSYAQLCLDNSDTDSAIRSSKHAIKLARFTSHNSPDNYVALAQAQIAHADNLGSSDSKKMVNEALKNLAVAADDRRASDWIRISVKLGETLQKRREGDADEASAPLEQAERSAVATARYSKDELPTIIGCIKQFYELGSPDTANYILKRLSEIFSEDPEVLNRLDRVSAEPITPNGRRKATKINKEGVLLYKSRDFEGAKEKFSEGITMFPQSAELHLNYILIIISIMESQGSDSTLENECHKSIELVKKLDVAMRYNERLSKYSRRLSGV